MCYPLLIEMGYGKMFSASILVSAGCLGMVIPPSVPLTGAAALAGGMDLVPLYQIAAVAGVAAGVLLIIYAYLYCLRKGNGILARKRTGEIQHAFIIVSSRESRHPVRSTGDRCADRRFGVARQIDLLVGAAAGEERCTAREGEKQCIFIHVFHRLLFFG